MRGARKKILRLFGRSAQAKQFMNEDLVIRLVSLGDQLGDPRPRARDAMELSISWCRT